MNGRDSSSSRRWMVIICKFSIDNVVCIGPVFWGMQVTLL